VSGGAATARVVGEVVVGLLLAGLLVGLALPARSPAVGPAAALGVSILCVGGVVLLDRWWVRRR
jgi:hypothetical protein